MALEPLPIAERGAKPDGGGPVRAVGGPSLGEVLVPLVESSGNPSLPAHSPRSRAAVPAQRLPSTSGYLVSVGIGGKLRARLGTRASPLHVPLSRTYHRPDQLPGPWWQACGVPYAVFLH